MDNKQDLKLEAKLVKLGFKKRWLDDKSGYWMVYSFKGYMKLRYEITVETDRKLMEVSFILERKLGYNDYMNINYKYSEANILKVYKELKRFK